MIFPILVSTITYDHILWLIRIHRCFDSTNCKSARTTARQWILRIGIQSTRAWNVPFSITHGVFTSVSRLLPTSRASIDRQTTPSFHDKRHFDSLSAFYKWSPIFGMEEGAFIPIENFKMLLANLVIPGQPFWVLGPAELNEFNKSLIQWVKIGWNLRYEVITW